MDYAAVLFDMDGLLLDTEALCRAAFMAVAPGIPDREAFYPRLIGHREAQNMRQLTDWLGSAAAANDLWALWGEEVRRRVSAGIPVKGGALDLMQALHGAGIPMAVVTSTRAEQARDHLRDAGLLTFLSALVGGDDVTCGKPDPEPYLTGAARLGVDAAECVAFEDSPTGVRAAVSAGCRVVQVPDLIPGDSTLGALIAPDLMAGARAVGLIG